MPILNEQGQVALKKLNQTPQYVELSQSKGYVFSVQHNISLAWVDEQDTAKVLAVTKDCHCGGPPKPLFIYASESDVAIWQGLRER